MPTYNHPIFGKVQFTIGKGGGIKVTSPSIPIKAVYVPALDGAPMDSGRFRGSVWWHEEYEDQLLGAWKEVAAHNLMKYVLTWDGSYNPRLVRGSSSVPSNHAFGTAFDINAGWNGLGVYPPESTKRGTVRPLVEIFKKWGFAWGGDYRRRKDGMHFEIVRKVSSRDHDSDAPRSISVVINGVQRVVPALLINGMAWIGARALCQQLKGSVVKVTDDAITLKNANGTLKVFEARFVDGTGYIKGMEIGDLFPGERAYDNDTKTWSLKTK